MHSIRHTVFGLRSQPHRAHIHTQRRGGREGVWRRRGGGTGEESRGVCAYGGGRRQSGPHTRSFLSPLNSCFGATAVRRLRQRGRFWDVYVRSACVE